MATTFSEKLLGLVKKHYKDKYDDVYTDIVAKLIENNHRIEGLKVEDIITCMKKYPDNKDIQRNGLRLLGNLACNNPDIKKQITDRYGINLAFDIMKKYSVNQEIQRNGLGLLGNLASNHSNNKQDICDKDGINLAFDILKKYPDNKDIQRYGLHLLGNLAWDNPDNVRKITDKDGIDFTFDILKKYPDNKDIQENAKKLLDILQTTNKRDREEDNTIEPKISQKVRKLDNGNYITDDGIVLVPSMKALNETQTAIKVKLEKE